MGITPGDLRLGEGCEHGAAAPEQISTSPSSLLHLLEPGGRASPPAAPRGWLPGQTAKQQRGPRSSSPHLEESVEQEGKPVRQHLLRHRLGPGEGRGHTSHTEPGPSAAALLGLVTASPVTLSSPHAVQITAWLSKSLRFTAVPGNQGQPSDNGREIAAFSPVPPSVLSPHCARDYL